MARRAADQAPKRRGRPPGLVAQLQTLSEIVGRREAPTEDVVERIQTAALRLKREIEGRRKARGHDAVKVGRANKDVREIARQLVEDPAYRKELRSRLRAGVAGNIELLLWQYAYGKPKRNEDQEEAERQRFEKVRGQVLAFLKESPDRAHQLDGAVQRATRLLPLPTRLHKPIDIRSEIVADGATGPGPA